MAKSPLQSATNPANYTTEKMYHRKKVIGVIIKFITEDNASGFLIQRPMAIPKIPKQKADNKIPKKPQRFNIGTSKIP